MGEAEQPPQKAIPAAVKTMIVDTLGGRIQVSWDKDAAATPMGQIVFFAAYLETSGLFDTWVEDCPLIYTATGPMRRTALTSSRINGGGVVTRPGIWRVAGFLPAPWG